MLRHVAPNSLNVLVMNVQKYEGRLLWMEDVPIANSDVVLIAPDGAELAHERTDDEGYFSFGSPFPAGCQVACVDLPDQDQTAIYARIVRADGLTAVANVEARITEFGEPRAATTDDNGILRIEDLTDHFYNVQVEGITVRIQAHHMSELAAAQPQLVILSGKLSLSQDDDGFDTFESTEEEQDLDAVELGELSDPDSEGTS